jgi:hypothetical protein
MLSNRDLPDPESLFEVELQDYNAQTLSQLIPSAEQPLPRKVTLWGGEATVEPSGAYYVFGSIRYKRAEDAVPEAKVSLRIYPPAASGSQKVFQDFVVTVIGDSKTYFLTSLFPAVLYTWNMDTAQPLRYKILKAQVIKYK